MSGLFGSTTIPGNRLTDLAGQTSTVGKPIPFGYGRVKVEEANVIWTSGIPREHVTKKKQGKGGVKTTEYTYTLDYAVAFMAGPVYGFLTIKRGGKVVYTNDPNAKVDDKLYALKWLRKAKIYLGTEQQMPDPTIEAIKGAGRVSAFRGLVYIVLKDDDVTSEGGAVPQYEAVIIATPPDIYLTSKPYPNDMEPEGTGAGVTLLAGDVRQIKRNIYPQEQLNVSTGLQPGELRAPIIRVALAPEELGVTSFSLQQGELRLVVKRVYMAPETVNATLATMQPGVLAVKLIKYTYWPAEKLNAGATLLPGTLGA